MSETWQQPSDARAAAGDSRAPDARAAAAGSWAPSPTARVEARAVSKRFGATQALRDVSMEITDGEIHALVGRNGAGKSTLVGVLTGIVVPDSGQVLYESRPAPDPREREKWRRHVACVYQKPTVVPALTVVENLFLGQLPGRRGGLVDWSQARRRARAALDEWNIPIALDARVWDLTVEQRQIVEIARALLRGSRFIILDEPTAELEGRAIAHLFEHVRRLREAHGISFMYISHHLNEVFDLCQRVTVLRDGRKVTTAEVADIDRQRLIDAMVGAEAGVLRAGRRARGAGLNGAPAAVLEVRDLRRAGEYESVSFTVARGECVGLAGLVGSGKESVGDTIAGFIAPNRGEIRMLGRRVAPGRVDRSIGSGIAYVPEDRYARGFVAGMSVCENLTMPIAGRLGPAGLISPRRREARARELIARLGVKVSSPGQAISELSGGNQQKCTLGRALSSEPRALVLMAPTSGVDIASKEALYDSIADAQQHGTAVLLVSDEVDELRICQRVLVLFKGRIVREFAAGWAPEDLVAAMEGWNGAEE